MPRTRSARNKGNDKVHKPKCFVEGYVREYADKIKRTVPSVIAVLMYKYYWIPPTEKFESIGNRMKFWDDEHMEVRQSYDRTWNHAFGSIIIDASEKKTYLWRFRITGCYAHNGLRIGIAQYMIGLKKQSIIQKPNIWSYCSDGLKYDSTSKKSKNGEDYGDEYDIDDIVEMKLTFPAKKSFGVLRYIVNDEDQGIAFDEIAKQDNYKMIISMGAKRTSIKLLKYS